MGVYIKGMEMPKNCHSCPMCLMRFCQARDRELSEQETRPNAKCPEDCPLVPVPEPHGRLIDADALIAAHKDVCSRSMKFNLDLAPTIIEADKADMDSFIRIFEEDDEEDGMDSFIQILED